MTPVGRQRSASSSRIKAVLFDLDGTLYDRDRVVEELLAAQYRAFAAELHGLSAAKFLRDVLAMDDHGYGVKEAGYRDLVDRWQLEASLAERLLSHFWDTYDGHCRLAADVSSTLDRLRERGLRLAIVTNGEGRRQRAKIGALGLGASFDAILVSGEEGVRKPDAEMFFRALRRCGVGAHEALFVGDHPVVDVQGAHLAGLLAVWKHVPYWEPVIADAPVIRDLTDLLKICDQRE
ncbi:MAG TPA: HAD family hydrolase [Steroidobacteraceae bacterium]|nr:HAD family hydrolase [Steroidobacteraceae bacterium]